MRMMLAVWLLSALSLGFAHYLQVHCGLWEVVPLPVYGVAIALAVRVRPGLAIPLLLLLGLSLDLVNSDLVGPRPALFVLCYAMTERLRFRFAVNRMPLVLVNGAFWTLCNQLLDRALASSAALDALWPSPEAMLTPVAAGSLVTAVMYLLTRKVIDIVSPESRSLELV